MVRTFREAAETFDRVYEPSVPVVVVTVPSVTVEPEIANPVVLSLTVPVIVPVAGVPTVRIAVPDFPLKAAVMVEEPAATPVARPLLLIVAADVGSEVQVTCVVIFCVVPSEYVPVAVNGWVPPTAMLAVVGVTAMEDRVAVVPLLPVSPPPPAPQAESKATAERANITH
jgi:hypothetical protein